MLETCLLTLVTAANSLYTSFYYILYWSYMTGYILVNSLNGAMQYLIFGWESCACFFAILWESLGIFFQDNLQLVKLVSPQVASAIVAIYSCCLGTFMKCSAFVRAVLNAITWVFSCLWGGLTVILNGLISLVTVIKKIVIIFGSGVWFLITIVPLLLYYSCKQFFTFIGSFISELGDVCATGVSMVRTIITSIILFVIDVPFESLAGLIVGLSFLYIFTQFYIILRTFIRGKYLLLKNWYRSQNFNIYYPFQNTRTRPRQALPLPKARRPVRQTQQPNDTIEEDEDCMEKNCVICQERIKCIVLLPCKHLCLCPQCSDELRYYNQSCPICRTDIDATMKIFI